MLFCVRAEIHAQSSASKPLSRVLCVVFAGGAGPRDPRAVVCQQAAGRVAGARRRAGVPRGVRRPRLLQRCAPPPPAARHSSILTSCHAFCYMPNVMYFDMGTTVQTFTRARSSNSFSDLHCTNDCTYIVRVLLYMYGHARCPVCQSIAWAIFATTMTPTARTRATTTCCYSRPATTCSPACRQSPRVTSSAHRWRVSTSSTTLTLSCGRSSC